MKKAALTVIGGMFGLIVAASLIDWLAPTFEKPGVYRPLFGIVVIFAASAVWRQIHGKEPK